MAKTTTDISSLHFSDDRDKEIIDMANKLAEAEKRSPHDAIRLLILEAGAKKLSSLIKTQTNQLNG